MECPLVTNSGQYSDCSMKLNTDRSQSIYPWGRCPKCGHPFAVDDDEIYTTKIWMEDEYVHVNTGEGVGLAHFSKLCRGCGVPICAVATVTLVGVEDSRGNDLILHDFTPVFLEPPQDVFPLSSELADPVRIGLKAAFSSFWIRRYDNAANDLRRVLELVCDDVGVPRFSATGPKKSRSRLTLASRFERMCSTNFRGGQFAPMRPHLDAIRYLSNVASHEFDAVTREDMLSVFEVAEGIVASIFKGKLLREKSRLIAKKFKPTKSRNRARLAT